MTVVLALLSSLSAWLLVDRRAPPARLLALAPRDRPGRSAPWTADLQAGVRRSSSRRHRPAPTRRRADGRVADLAASVDLLAVAVSAGYSLHGAVRVAGTEGAGPVAAALGRVAAEFDRGVPLAEGLAELPQTLGPEASVLATTLSVAAASGTPLGPALQRLADAERRRSRRAAEARARRLPVLLLGPLVGLVLPAFVVLTIVPAALSSVVGRPVPIAQRPVTPLPPSTSLAATVVPGP